jgi:hypothetical protein
MGYTKAIETKNAVYVLSLETHSIPDYSVFKDQKFDFVVIEQGMKRDKRASSELKKCKEFLVLRY